MDTMSSEKRWEKIDATLDRTTALAEENEKGLKELKEAIEKTNAAIEKTIAAIFGENKERETASKELDEKLDKLHKAVFGENKEREISMAELKEAIEKTNKAVFGVNSEVKGIANSNGMVAEDYFYASLDKSKTLGGVHFDSMIRNVANVITLEDGKKINEEFDGLMYNKTSVCIVEVKYKVKMQDVRKLAKKRVEHFKLLFPMYANYKIYLAIGGMTFEKGAIDAAKELGMGVLQLDGDAVVVYDKDLKVY